MHGRRTQPKAPLISDPTIATPFSKIALDIIGPLPESDKGNSYILTIIDYATRYPDAMPLPDMKSTTVIEALLEMFSRVGIPEEIVHDQGRSFMSAVMSELCSELQIKEIITTPYHPQANGLIEKFNGTIKSMLHKSEEGQISG